MPQLYPDGTAKPGMFAPHEARLKDGTPVMVRAPREDDVVKIATAFANLDQDSIYTRFFHLKKALTDDEMGRLTHADMDARVFLFASVGEGTSEAIVGAADYAAYDDADGARAAEVAFLVEEEFQGRGLATLLFAELMKYARAHGIVRLTADVLPRNEAMLRVFAKSGLANEKRLQDGVIHVIMEMPR